MGILRSADRLRRGLSSFADIFRERSGNDLIASRRVVRFHEERFQVIILPKFLEAVHKVHPIHPGVLQESD